MSKDREVDAIDQQVGPELSGEGEALEDEGQQAVAGISSEANRDALDTLESRELTSLQRNFVLKKIKEGYQRMEELYLNVFDYIQRSQFGYPREYEVRNSVLNAITPEQVEYMMNEDNASFNFGIIYVSPDNRLLIARKLMEGQQSDNGRRSKMTVRDTVTDMLDRSREDVPRPEWQWCFYQDGDMNDSDYEMKADSIADGLMTFKEGLPEGMKGTDLLNFSAFMASRIASGEQPIGYSDSQITATVLDEEGEFDGDGLSYYAAGDIKAREGNSESPTEVRFKSISGPVPEVRFRASLQGKISYYR